MSLHWTIHPDQRFFHTVCEGNVEGHEVHAMLDAMLEAQALGYRKMFDGTRGETDMGAMELIDIGVRMRSLHKGGVHLGPLAIVIPEDKYALLARVLGMLAAPRRPMRIFKTAKLAQRWLNSAPILASLPESVPVPERVSVPASGPGSLPVSAPPSAMGPEAEAAAAASSSSPS